MRNILRERPRSNRIMLPVFIFSTYTLILALGCHAAVSPHYETGIFVFLSPAIFLLSAGLFVTLLCRVKKSWLWAVCYSLVSVLINVIFPPAEAFFGEFTQLAQWLVGFEVACGLSILLCMQSPQVQDCFAARSPTRPRMQHDHITS